MKTTKDIICEAVVEAQTANVSLKHIREVTEISIRTLQRWLQQSREDHRKGSSRQVRHKLTNEERNEIIRVVNLPEYRNMNPAEIVAILAENGQYIGSERTIYRV
ncbi:MAG: helix-turn-helix domain-containing protein, partial [Leptonema sp. (in: Bacteria)]|nr:helix-turn-helix domain-containing protein [Leptonema sp. (in: bacteria)]